MDRLASRKSCPLGRGSGKPCNAARFDDIFKGHGPKMDVVCGLRSADTRRSRVDFFKGLVQCSDKDIRGEALMHISTYHIHNVLKAYGKQLSLSRRRGESTHGIAPNRTDSITISSEARRKAVIEKVAEDVVERIVRFGPRDAMEQDVFKELEGEYGSNLAMGGDSAELVFKVIDKENGEEMKTLSIEDSRFLKRRLEEITRDKVNDNMI